MNFQFLPHSQRKTSPYTRNNSLLVGYNRSTDRWTSERLIKRASERDRQTDRDRPRNLCGECTAVVGEEFREPRESRRAGVLSRDRCRYFSLSPFRCPPVPVFVSLCRSICTWELVQLCTVRIDFTHLISSINFPSFTPKHDGWMDGQVDGWTGGRPDRQTDKQTDMQTDGHADGWTCGRADMRTDGQVDGRTDRRADGRIDRWTDVCWMDGRTGERTDK